MFEQPGDYDDSSFFYLLRDPSLRALDQSIKTNRRLGALQASLGAQPRDDAGTPQHELRIRELEQRCLALGLYAQALGQLLVSKGLATPDEIREAIVDVDLLDGKLDGR